MLENSKLQNYSNANSVGANPVCLPTEVERELSKLRETAEILDITVGKLCGRIESVVRSEPPSADATKGDLNAAASTILGRNLASLNGQLRSSMAILESTIQRIEL